MKQFFINSEEKRLKAGWRILVFFIIFITLNILLSLGIRTLVGSLKGGGTLWFTILGISATIAFYISRKFIDKESFSSIGLFFNKMAVLDILSGFLNSALVMTGMFFLLLFLGQIEFNGFSWWTDSDAQNPEFKIEIIPVIVSVFWQFTVVAWWEELAFRGIVLQNISKGMGLIWAIVLSSIIFGLVHSGNPNATFLSTFMIILITPQLIYAYLKTGQLWLPMGLHLGWNFFQASIFGFASSGQSSPTMIQQTPIGADWLSGGDFGAEGSVLLIPFLIASFFIIHWYTQFTRTPNQGFFSFLVK